MRKKVGIISMWIFLGLTIAFQIAYYIGLRNKISNVEVFYSHLTGRPTGTTPREVADYFVCCVGLVHYFLFGYLYSVKKHYTEKRLHGKDGKIKRWVGVEIFCQLGIFLSYLFLWLDNLILYHMVNEIIPYWGTGTSTAVLYLFLCKKEIISTEYAWVEQYGGTFNFIVIIAPVLLMLLIYSIHCVFRFIQFKRNNCFSLIWAVWTAVFILAIVLLAVWNFRQLDFERWWRSHYDSGNVG